MWNALILTGWLILLGAPSAAIFGLAVPATRRGARVRRLALVCAGFVLAVVAVHRVMDVFIGRLLLDVLMDAFDVDLELVGLIPGMVRAHHQARILAIAITRWWMAPIAAVLFCGFVGLLRLPAVRRWLYGDDDK